MHPIDKYIETIPDFPEKGIMFRDITTVTQDPEGFKLAVDSMQDLIKDLDYDVMVGVEARGFIFGAAIAYNMGKGLSLVRKKGKLPHTTISQEYDLEYGTATVEMHVDAIKPGQKVVIIDDLIATGGSAKAAIDLVEKLGAEVVDCLFLVELKGLNGRAKLDGYRVDSVISYEGK